MKYEKNQYSDGISFCSLVIAGAFLYWGINWLIDRNWVGIVFIFIGGSILLGQFYALTNKKKLRNIVLTEFERNPNTTVEEIAKNTGISRKDVKAIILDLKADGSLRGVFSSTTGQLEMASVTHKTKPRSDPQPQPEPEPVSISQSETKVRFCPNCGTAVEKPEAKFCPYCGSNI